MPVMRYDKASKTWVEDVAENAFGPMGPLGVIAFWLFCLVGWAYIVTLIGTAIVTRVVN